MNIGVQVKQAVPARVLSENAKRRAESGVLRAPARSISFPPKADATMRLSIFGKQNAQCCRGDRHQKRVVILDVGELVGK